MCAMDIAEVEALQAEAEDIAEAGLDDAARAAGFDWATRIGRFIA